jgi:hypothetical protein
MGINIRNRQGIQESDIADSENGFIFYLENTAWNYFRRLSEEMAKNERTLFGEDRKVADTIGSIWLYNQRIYSSNTDGKNQVFQMSRIIDYSNRMIIHVPDGYKNWSRITVEYALIRRIGIVDEFIREIIRFSAYYIKQLDRYYWAKGITQSNKRLGIRFASSMTAEERFCSMIDRRVVTNWNQTLLDVAQFIMANVDKQCIQFESA